MGRRQVRELVGTARGGCGDRAVSSAATVLADASAVQPISVVPSNSRSFAIAEPARRPRGRRHRRVVERWRRDHGCGQRRVPAPATAARGTAIARCRSPARTARDRWRGRRCRRARRDRASRRRRRPRIAQRRSWWGSGRTPTTARSATSQLDDVHAHGCEVEDAGPGAPHTGHEDVDCSTVHPAGHDAGRRPPEVVRARDREPSVARRADEVDAAAVCDQHAVVLEAHAGAMLPSGAGRRSMCRRTTTTPCPSRRSTDAGRSAVIQSSGRLVVIKLKKPGVSARWRAHGRRSADAPPAPARDYGLTRRCAACAVSATGTPQSSAPAERHRALLVRSAMADRIELLRTPQPATDRSARRARDPQLHRRGGDGGDRTGDRPRRGDHLPRRRRLLDADTLPFFAIGIGVVAVGSALIGILVGLVRIPFLRQRPRTQGADGDGRTHHRGRRADRGQEPPRGSHHRERPAFPACRRDRRRRAQLVRRRDAPVQHGGRDHDRSRRP